MKFLTRTIDKSSDDDGLCVDVLAIRAILNEHGYDALLQDIEWAYGELCEEDYAATWLPLDFFPGRKMVDGIKRYLTELPEEPAAT